VGYDARKVFTYMKIKEFYAANPPYNPLSLIRSRYSPSNANCINLETQTVRFLSFMPDGYALITPQSIERSV
jgi:hypothetical protein